MIHGEEVQVKTRAKDRLKKLRADLPELMKESIAQKGKYSDAVRKGRKPDPKPHVHAHEAVDRCVKEIGFCEGILKQPDVLTVSIHAKARYAQKVMNLVVPEAPVDKFMQALEYYNVTEEEIEAHILTDKLRFAVGSLGNSGKFPVSHGVSAVLVNGVVVTVYTSGDR